MKKLLLGTTVLFGAASLATSAQAADPTVSISGFLDSQAGFTSQDSNFETGADSRDFKFQNDAEVHINAEGQSDKGLKYGAVIELEADINADGDGEGLNADKTYIYLENNETGRVELGSNTSVADAMKVDAVSVAVATGGIDGDFYDFANVGGQYLSSPDLPTAFAGGATEDAAKISYYTPRFSGLQFGVSFTPDGGDAGTASGFTGSNNGDQENVINLGLNYDYEYSNGTAVQASFTGESGQSESAGTEDLQAWQVGLGMTVEGWSFAGSYADIGESGLATTATNKDQSFWTLGAAYATGPYGVSVTYMASEVSDNEFSNLAVGADYQLVPGLVPYVEVNMFETDDNNAATTDNDGSVVLVGAELTF